MQMLNYTTCMATFWRQAYDSWQVCCTCNAGPLWDKTACTMCGLISGTKPHSPFHKRNANKSASITKYVWIARRKKLYYGSDVNVARCDNMKFEKRRKRNTMSQTLWQFFIHREAFAQKPFFQIHTLAITHRNIILHRRFCVVENLYKARTNDDCGLDFATIDCFFVTNSFEPKTSQLVCTMY